MIPNRRRQQGLQYGIFLLFMQALNFGIERIPPATLIGVIIQTLLYMGYIKVPWNPEEVCISAIKIIKYKEWRSLFFSHLEHASDMHLYYNMVSFILKGSYLESLYGTTNFVLLLFILSTGCSFMYVGLNYLLMQLTGDYQYLVTCAIGFSGSLFALKLLVLCEQLDRLHNISGFQVPSKLAVWAELILIHLLVPNASFVGHLAGILIGCLYCYTFVGEVIDNLIHTITGTPIIHEERFYRRRNGQFT
ncbi:rhomboid-related protein 4-like isoform X2 [Pseudomyrmex gracilis]|nr:rhomboid-related protein 4-like isoform X2 [Pseudomyrmex gracilis]